MNKLVTTVKPLWCGKMPIDTLDLLDKAGYETEDGDKRIRFNMDLPLFDVKDAGSEGLNDFANEAILAGELAGVGLSDLNFSLVPGGTKAAGGEGTSFTGTLTLEIDASVKDIFTDLTDEG